MRQIPFFLSPSNIITYSFEFISRSQILGELHFSPQSIPKINKKIQKNQGSVSNFDYVTKSSEGISKCKTDFKLISSSLVLTDHCSNKLKRLMKNEDEDLSEDCKAVENGKPLDIPVGHTLEIGNLFRR